jgi:hypothetical protein
MKRRYVERLGTHLMLMSRVRVIYPNHRVQEEGVAKRQTAGITHVTQEEAKLNAGRFKRFYRFPLPAKIIVPAPNQFTRWGSESVRQHFDLCIQWLADENVLWSHDPLRHHGVIKDWGCQHVFSVENELIAMKFRLKFG